MDDTIWIAQSQEELQNILKITTSFFTFTNIKVNLNKSVLAVNNSRNTNPSIIFNYTTINSINPKETFRILGYWYTISKNYKPTHKIIKKEAENAIKRIQHTKLTDKQAVYIINTVLLTHIFYRIQNTFLLSTLYKKLTN